MNEKLIARLDWESIKLRITSPSFNNVGLFIALIAMSAYFATQSPYYLSVRNFLNIGNAVAIRGTVAAGLTMVMISGGLDISIAATMAATGMVTASLAAAGFPEVVTIVLGIVSGCAIGAVNGFFVTRLRINPIITTLATMSAIRGLGYVISGGKSVHPSVADFGFMGRGAILGLPAPLFWFALVVVIVFLVLRYTILGHYCYAIGSNPDACRVSGVRVDWWRMWLYVICGATSALGGIMLFAMSATAKPTAAMGAELDILTAIILGGISLSGGTGGIVGTVLGMLILGNMRNGLILMNVAPYWQVVLRGIVLMFAVALDSIRTGGYK